MPIGIQTPRDKFDQIIAFVRRTMRYWWLVGIIGFIGGVLSVLLALSQDPRFMSQAKVFYNERIQSSILQGSDLGINTRNLAYRYQEMLLSRTNMLRLINEKELFPEVMAKKGEDAAIEEFEKAATFRTRGTGMFTISFMAKDPELAQSVAARMVEILIAEDEKYRLDQATATMDFLIKRKAKIEAELEKRQRELAEFINKNPEFALDSSASAGGRVQPGVVIRAQNQAQNQAQNDPRGVAVVPGTPSELQALERQRRRLRARIDAPDNVEPVPVPKTPERIEAEQRVDEAERELRRATRTLEDRSARFTDAHPDVISAQLAVEDARSRLNRAKAQLPPLPKPEPPTPIDREELRSELRRIERNIAELRAKQRNNRTDDGDKSDADEEPRAEESEGSWVVALETEHARLKQAVEEQSNRLESTDNSLSRAELKSSQQTAEQGEVLSIIDPANLPTMPEGKGRGILAAAGTAVFLMLGAMLALALALVDDRIYGGGDLERLAIAPVAVVVPKSQRPKRAKRPKKVRPRKQQSSG